MLDYHPILQYGNVGGVSYRAQPVSYRQYGSISGQTLQGILDEFFRDGVECAGRFVQDQDFGILWKIESGWIHVEMSKYSV